MIGSHAFQGDAYDVVHIANEVPVNRRGGVATVANALHGGLLARGVASLLLVLDHMHSATEMRATLDSLPNVVFATADHLPDLRTTLVHSHAYRYTPALMDLVRRVPTIATLHSIAAAESSGLPVVHGDDVEGQIRLIEAATAVAVVSRAELERYDSLGYRAYNPNAVVVHNGVPLPGWHRQSPPRRAILGYCGRIVPRKRPEFVLRALAEPQFANATALFAGRPYTMELEKWLGAPGVAARTRLLGWCSGPRLERFFAEIDVLVVPSMYEPSGLVAIEASLRGVPVVCTRADGLVESMGDHAFYSPGVDYPDLLSALTEWREATDDRVANRADSARRRAESFYSADAMTARYLDLYQTLWARFRSV